jgi:hypothetical protein
VTPGQLAAAADCLAEGYRLLDTLPVEEAARRAWTPTGPAIPELEARIRARRAAQTPALAVATPVPRRGRAISPRRRKSA